MIIHHITWHDAPGLLHPFRGGIHRNIHKVLQWGKQEVQLIALAEDGTLQSFSGSPSPPLFFFLNLIHFQPLSAFFGSLSPERSLFTPLSSKIPQKPKCFPPFLFFLSSCLYKHNMYRNSTQTNMFLNDSFHIQIQFFYES